MTHTKIICTIGPAVASIELILELMKAGMNVARLNFSHGTHAEHGKVIAMLKEARAIAGRPLAIMLDTKGPEIRLGKVQKGGVELHPLQKIWLVKEKIEGNNEALPIVPAYVLDSIEVGTRILIDNGYIASTVIDKTEAGVLIQIENHGHVTSSKGVNVPNVTLPLPALTETDTHDIEFGIDQDVDSIAASFVRSQETVLLIKELLQKKNKSAIQVIAKIENSAGIDNFDAILEVADGIMIARGDLGVEIPLSRVPRLQKMMIRKCYLAGKPVVTATQMLESMIHQPRPTRAEVSDVANAIYDSSSAVMLSGETAIGKYPLECVRIMKSIITEAEDDFNYAELFDQHAKILCNDVQSAVTLASVKTANSLNVKAIFTFTHSGQTARLISRLRPKMPIIALTPNPKTFQQLALNWGIIPVLATHSTNIDEAFQEASDFAKRAGYVLPDDVVVLTTGTPFFMAGTTNTILVERIK